MASPSYCDDWSIAQVLSHLGFGRVIFQRSLQDVRNGTIAPDDFNPSVWDAWNAKTPRAQADDALVADEAVTEAIEAVGEAERAELVLQLGAHEPQLRRLRRHAAQRACLSHLGHRSRPGPGARLSDVRPRWSSTLGRIVASAAAPAGGTGPSTCTPLPPSGPSC